MRIVSLAFLLGGLLGCPPTEAKKEEPPKTCTKIGQTCEVSPGKLGTCVAQDTCPTPGQCFVCQSQH